MVEIRLNMLFYSSLVGVYDGEKDELHFLDSLAISSENRVTLQLLCKAALQKGETAIVVDNHFFREKGKLF